MSEHYKGRGHYGLGNGEYAVFVDNLPQKLDRHGLKGIFRKVGDVSDSYIPAKLGRSRRRFGFIRFWKEVDAIIVSSCSMVALSGVIGSRCVGEIR